MKCPMKFNRPLYQANDETIQYVQVGNLNCEIAECAWWDEHFGKCSIAVEAYLKGVADHRLEVKESLRDRY